MRGRTVGSKHVQVRAERLESAGDGIEKCKHGAGADLVGRRALAEQLDEQIQALVERLRLAMQSAQRLAGVDLRERGARIRAGGVGPGT
ncbi:MAG: hypothetical protein KBC94_14695 [Pseudacidovorax sp.]|uniref:Uncharacterized protein n=1 Tax=Pseudacidovorax intermedius TaxID=433924 RepID=A0A370FGM8_9BURK|nr:MULTISPECIES: hypothetical protein [Pseudacidovorax]MBP6895666.1 hypothetical protein [Pseudacidovorax sp.]RDI25205.1 hypothetical protein DFR41_104262 [Pseudacidovorax intermedius]